MMTRVLRVALCSVVVLLSACSSVDDNPGAFEFGSDTIHVYVPGSRKPIEIAAADQVVTLLDAVCKVGHSAGNLRHVLVLRRAGAETVRFEVDVREMVRTGNSAANIQLQPGDLVKIAG